MLGPNGAGKSTLLRVLLGLLPPSTGSVSVLGGPPGRRNTEIGYLPQRHAFDSSTRIRGVDLVRLGLDGTRLGFPLPWRTERSARVEEAIELVGASAYARRSIGELLGRRAAAAADRPGPGRRPQLLLLDEPLDSLDLPNQTAVSGPARPDLPLPDRWPCCSSRTTSTRCSHTSTGSSTSPAAAIVAGPPERGDHERDAERPLRRRRSRCSAPRTGGSSSSAQPEAPAHHCDRHDTATRGTDEPAPLARPGLGSPPAAGLPVHGQRARGGDDRRPDGRGGGLVHGASAADLRRAHALGDVVPRRERRCARRDPARGRLLRRLARSRRSRSPPARGRTAATASPRSPP